MCLQEQIKKSEPTENEWAHLHVMSTREVWGSTFCIWLPALAQFKGWITLYFHKIPHLIWCCVSAVDSGRTLAHSVAMSHRQLIYESYLSLFDGFVFEFYVYVSVVVLRTSSHDMNNRQHPAVLPRATDESTILFARKRHGWQSVCWQNCDAMII